jgi:hypothetical protein
MYLIAGASMPMQGFYDALAYGVTPTVLNNIKKKLFNRSSGRIRTIHDICLLC